MSAKKLVTLLGPPGCGKGTVSQMICSEEGSKYVHVSTGDMLREEIKSKSDLGKRVEKIIGNGDFVDDETMFEIVKKKLKAATKTVILDGFPRTLEQAVMLDDLLESEGLDILAVHFIIDKDKLRKRIVGRRVHIPSGRVYNIYFSPPKVPGKDDVTGEELVHREDDTEPVFERRYEHYVELTLPVIEKYEKDGRIHEIQADDTISNVYEAFKKALEEH